MLLPLAAGRHVGRSDGQAAQLSGGDHQRRRAKVSGFAVRHPDDDGPQRQVLLRLHVHRRVHHDRRRTLERGIVFRFFTNNYSTGFYNVRINSMLVRVIPLQSLCGL